MKKKINSSRIHKVSNAKSISTKKGNRSIMKNRLPKKSLRRKNSSSKKSLRKKIGGSKKRTVRGKNVKRTLKKLRGGADAQAETPETVASLELVPYRDNLGKKKITNLANVYSYPAQKNEQGVIFDKMRKRAMKKYIDQNKKKFLKDNNTITFNLMRYGFKLSEEDENFPLAKNVSLQKELNKHVKKVLRYNLQRNNSLLQSLQNSLENKGYKGRYNRLLKVCSYFFNNESLQTVTNQKITKLLNIFYNIFFYRDGKKNKTEDYAGPYILSNTIKSKRGYKINNDLVDLKNYIENIPQTVDNLKPFFLYYLIYNGMKPENVSTLNGLTKARTNIETIPQPPARGANGGLNEVIKPSKIQQGEHKHSLKINSLDTEDPVGAAANNQSTISPGIANQGVLYNSQGVEYNQGPVTNKSHYSISTKLLQKSTPKIALINFGAINDSPLEFVSTIHAGKGVNIQVADLEKDCAKYLGRNREDDTKGILTDITIKIESVIEEIVAKKSFLLPCFIKYDLQNYKNFIYTRDFNKSSGFDSKLNVNSLFQLLDGKSETENTKLGIPSNIHGGKFIAGLEGEIPVEMHPFKSKKAFDICRNANHNFYDMIKNGIKEAFLKRMAIEEDKGSTLCNYYYSKSLYQIQIPENEKDKSQAVYKLLAEKVNYKKNKANGKRIAEKLYEHIISADDSKAINNINKLLEIHHGTDDKYLKDIISYYRYLMLGIYIYFIFIHKLINSPMVINDPETQLHDDGIVAESLEKIIDPDVGIKVKDKYDYINGMIKKINEKEKPDFIFINEGLPNTKFWKTVMDNSEKQKIENYTLISSKDSKKTLNTDGNGKRSVIFMKKDCNYDIINHGIDEENDVYKNIPCRAEDFLVKVRKKDTETTTFLHCIHNSNGINYKDDDDDDVKGFETQIEQLKKLYEENNYIIGIDSNCVKITDNDLTNFKQHIHYPEPNPNKKEYVEDKSTTYKKRSLFQSQSKYDIDGATKDYIISNSDFKGTIYKTPILESDVELFPFDHFVLFNYEMSNTETPKNELIPYQRYKETASGDPLLTSYQRLESFYNNPEYLKGIILNNENTYSHLYGEGDYKLIQSGGEKYELEVLTNGEFETYILDKKPNNPFDLYTIQMKEKEEKINTGIYNIDELINYLKNPSNVNIFEQTLHNKIEK